jgi:hypothetical protein
MLCALVHTLVTNVVIYLVYPNTEPSCGCNESIMKRLVTDLLAYFRWHWPWKCFRSKHVVFILWTLNIWSLYEKC